MYELDFFQALKVVLDGGCVKGNDFAKGCFLQLNDNGELVLVDANRFYLKEKCAFIKGLSGQKFRELKVMTLKELSY